MFVPYTHHCTWWLCFFSRFSRRWAMREVSPSLSYQGCFLAACNLTLIINTLSVQSLTLRFCSARGRVQIKTETFNNTTQSLSEGSAAAYVVLQIEERCHQRRTSRFMDGWVQQETGAHRLFSFIFFSEGMFLLLSVCLTVCPVVGWIVYQQDYTETTW